MIVALASDDQPWMDRNRPPEERAELLVAAMTFDEKLSQLHGQIGLNPEFPCGHSTRHVPGVPRLRIPTMRITNGPAGVGPGDCVPQKPGYGASIRPRTRGVLGSGAGVRVRRDCGHGDGEPGHACFRGARS